MKVCPDCKTAYSDDFESCESCDIALLDAPDALRDNPQLADVVEVGHDEETAMVDLEAMSDKLRARDAQRAAETPAKPDEEEDDDQTGTLNLDQLRKYQGVDQGGPQEETTQRTRGAPEGTLAAIVSDEEEEAPARAPLLIAVAAVGAVAVLGIGVAAWALLAQGAMVSISSIPSGATVLVDGKELGEAPLVAKVRKGAHTVELRMAGFLSFKEIIEVGPEGLNLAEELTKEGAAQVVDKADAGPAAFVDSLPLTGPDRELLDAEFERIKGMISSRELDDAFEAIKGFVKSAPDDPRGDELFDALAKARTAKIPVAPKPLSKAEKAERAQKLFEEGEGFYRDRNMGEARLKLLNALQYNPKMSGPHRVLARIYLSQGNEGRVRYHLERYLRLGGKDPDYAVRRWLDDHPATN